MNTWTKEHAPVLPQPTRFARLLGMLRIGVLLAITLIGVPLFLILMSRLRTERYR